jgi:hypothetical protein
MLLVLDHDHVFFNVEMITAVLLFFFLSFLFVLDFFKFTIRTDFGFSLLNFGLNFVFRLLF